MHVEDPGAHRAEKLAAHIAEDVVLLVEARGVQKHHLHEAGRRVGELVSSPSALVNPVMAPKEPLKNPCFLPLVSVRGLVGLVEEGFAEVHPAQHIFVFDRNLIEMYIGTGVLNVGFDQRRMLPECL